MEVYLPYVWRAGVCEVLVLNVSFLKKHWSHLRGKYLFKSSVCEGGTNKFPVCYPAALNNLCCPRVGSCTVGRVLIAWCVRVAVECKEDI